MPRPIVERLDKALDQVLSHPRIVRRIEDRGASVEAGTPEQLRAKVASELARWKRVLRQVALRVTDPALE